MSNSTQIRETTGSWGLRFGSATFGGHQGEAAAASVARWVTADTCAGVGALSFVLMERGFNPALTQHAQALPESDSWPETRERENLCQRLSLISLL